MRIEYIYQLMQSPLDPLARLFVYRLFALLIASSSIHVVSKHNGNVHECVDLLDPSSLRQKLHSPLFAEQEVFQLFGVKAFVARNRYSLMSLDYKGFLQVKSCGHCCVEVLNGLGHVAEHYHLSSSNMNDLLSLVEFSEEKGIETLHASLLQVLREKIDPSTLPAGFLKSLQSAKFFDGFCCTRPTK
jgi:hypothetical protein